MLVKHRFGMLALLRSVLRSLVAIVVVLQFAAAQTNSSLGDSTLETLGGSSSAQFQSFSSSEVLLTTPVPGTALSSSVFFSTVSSEVTRNISLSSNWITTSDVSLSILTAPLNATISATVLPQASAVTTTLGAHSDSSPFTPHASQIVPSSSSSFPTSIVLTESLSLNKAQVIIIAGAAGGGGGAILILLMLCVCCGCCCHRIKRRRSVKLMKKQDPPSSILFIPNYNQVIFQEVAANDTGVSEQRHKHATPVLTGHTLHSEHSNSPVHPILLLSAPDIQGNNTAAMNPASLPGSSKQTAFDEGTSVPTSDPTFLFNKGKEVPPNVHLSASTHSALSLPSNSLQAVQSIRPSSSTLPSSTNDVQLDCDHIASTLQPQMRRKLHSSDKQVIPPEVRISTVASTEQPLVNLETKRIPDKGMEAVTMPVSTSLEVRKPVPVPRKKLIKEFSNSTEDQYVDPRVFTRDRVLSLVLMENEAAEHAGDKAAEGEDLYVAMEHIGEESTSAGKVDAPVSPKYANVVRPQRNSFAGLSSRELPDHCGLQQKVEEEEYEQMTPELQKQLRRSTDPSLASCRPFQRKDPPAIEDNADEYVSVAAGSSLLEDVLLSCSHGVKDRVQHSQPNKQLEGQSIDGEQLYYNLA